MFIWLGYFVLLSFSLAEGVKNNVTEIGIIIGNTSIQLGLSPPETERLVMGNTDNVFVDAQLHNLATGDASKDTNQNNIISLKAQSEDTSIARVGDDNVIQIPLRPDPSNVLNNTFFTVEGEFLGRTHLNIYAKAKEGPLVTYKSGNQKSTDLSDPFAPPFRNHTGAVNTQISIDIPTTNKENLADDWQKLDVRYKVTVIREDRALDSIFLTTIIVLLLIANVGMGCKIDLAVVKEVLRRPIAPTIGFCCQFIVMPLVSDEY